MLVGDSHALIRERGANLRVAILQGNAEDGPGRRIFDGIVEEYQEELMEESFVADVRNLLVQITQDADIFSARTGIHQRTSLFEHFVDIQRLAHEMQLSGIRHRYQKK